MNKYKWAALFWTCFTIILSAIPSSAIPKTFLDEIFGIDKVAHITFYLFMTVLWSVYMRDIFGIYKSVKISALMSISIGIMMEIYQKVYFIDRSFDWLDAVANLIGVILGLILFLKYEKLFPIFANR